MSAGLETLMRQQAARIILQDVLADVADLADDILRTVFWKEVSARRARKLRKRGEQVKFSRHTRTGKARYLWAPCTDWRLK